MCDVDVLFVRERLDACDAFNWAGLGRIVETMTGDWEEVL